jgi:hypothetical protein
MAVQQLTPSPPGTLPQFTTPGLNTGIGGAAYGTVDPATQTAAGQLNTLMSSSSPLEQLAQAQGMNAAAARGSANGTLFAGAQEAALNDKLQPIALNDANAYQRQHLQNQSDVNQLKNTQTSVEGGIAQAGISANASIHNADQAAAIQKQSLEQSHQEFMTNWDNQFKMATQSQAFQQASQTAQNEFTSKNQALQTTFQTIMSDPSYWSDPTAASGMMNFFQSTIQDLMNQYGIGRAVNGPCHLHR